ncbi:hypothetical protein ACWV95_19820 [Streptomyces albus]
MSFGQEWAGLVANAQSKQSTSMQLNHAPSPDHATGGGGTAARAATARHST